MNSLAILIVSLIYAFFGSIYWSRKEISQKMPRMLLMFMAQRMRIPSDEWEKFCYDWDKMCYEKPQQFVVNIPYFSNFFRQDLLHKLPYDEYILTHEYK